MAEPIPVYMRLDARAKAIEGFLDDLEAGHPHVGVKQLARIMHSLTLDLMMLAHQIASTAQEDE